MTMTTTTRSIPLVLMLLAAAACGSPARSAEARPVAVDAVTSGLDGSPSAGFFSHDGTQGEFRARAENQFDVVVGQVAAPAGRLRIRRGWLQLRTGNPAEVGPRARAAVEEAGGWMEMQADLQYVFRVPAAQFDDVLASIEALGAVASKRVTAEDVTDRVRDLELRIRNARALRDRYAALLEKAEKVEDMLAIEKELAKLTETVERLEGEKQGLERDVAWSRLEVTLLPAGGPPSGASDSPFPWLARIGVARVPRTRGPDARSSRLRWELPAGFADMGRTGEDSVLGWAYSPEGIRVVVREFDHEPRADRAFWEKELRRELERVRGYEPVPDAPPGLLLYEQVVDGTPLRYAVRLVLDKYDLTVVEVVGPALAVERAWGDVARVLDGIAARRG